MKRVATPRTKFRFNSRKSCKKAFRFLNSKHHQLMASIARSKDGESFYLFVQNDNAKIPNRRILEQMEKHGGTFVELIY